MYILKLDRIDINLVYRAIGLPRLRNLVNVYTSSTNRNDPVYRELQDLIFFTMQIGKIADIFHKKNPWKMYLVQIFEISWLRVVIELISSHWNVIATCADSQITDIFFSCKCVINELTRTRHNCQSSRTHQYTRRQEFNKMRLHQTFSLLWKIQEYNCWKQWLSETFSGHFYGPSSHCLCRRDTQRIWKNAPFCWTCQP